VVLKTYIFLDVYLVCLLINERREITMHNYRLTLVGFLLIALLMINSLLLENPFSLMGDVIAVAKFGDEELPGAVMGVNASGRVTGRVTDIVTGTGISGAEVYLDSSAGNKLVFTDGSGYYQANDLSPGSYNVVVAKSGYARAHQYGVNVVSGLTTSGINFQLTTRMGQISGLVTNINGVPLKDVIILVDSTEGYGFGNTITDGNGKYLVTGLAPMQYYVHADASGYAAQVKNAIVYDGETTDNINFILGAADGGVSGRVTKDGQSASYAGIYINSSAGSNLVFYAHGFADAAGYYSLKNLPPGEYDVHVTDVAGYANQIRYFVPVGYSVVNGINFNLTHGDSTIQGFVKDHYGNPIPSVSIDAFQLSSPGMWASIATDANGFYSAAKLWGGEYTLFASHPDYAKVEKLNIPIPSGQTTRVDIVLSRERSLVVESSLVVAMVDTEQQVQRSMRIEISKAPETTWTATTNASWLFLGASGSSKTATGSTGNDLIIRFDPKSVGYGVYSTVITITAPDLDPLEIQVKLVKAQVVHTIHLPVIRQ
jgi:hypothetical protein